MTACFAAGCEGVSRKHDIAGDVNPPTQTQLAAADEPIEEYNFPDLVENMMMSRQDHIQTLVDMESAYLEVGDTVKANWSRRQRELFAKVEIYPYLTEETIEQTIDVSPEESSPEADEIYAQAVALVDQVALIPGAGVLQGNQDKARQALGLFKTILRDHPKSDKVDDCAYYCGVLYKEYLRDDDPDNELSVRYYRWAINLNPETPHPARFHCAVVLDYRRHERDRAIELYHQVLEESNDSNARWAATRIEQLTDEEFSHERPRDSEPGTVTGTFTSRRPPGDTGVTPSGPVASGTPDGSEPADPPGRSP